MEKSKKRYSISSVGKVRFKRDVVWRRYSDRGVILQTKGAKVLILNETGADLLELIDKGLKEEEVIKEMAIIYSGDRKEIKKEVKNFIKELLDKGVIERK